MEKEFVPYELALKLKKLGFDEPCLGYYAAYILCTGQPQEIQLDENGNYKKSKTESFPIIAAPTYSQAFRWFREKYKLSGIIEIGTQEYSFIIFDEEKDSREITSSMNGSYEEAELACLKKLIEIVEERNNE
jgi:hypothetical protein